MELLLIVAVVLLAVAFFSSRRKKLDAARHAEVESAELASVKRVVDEDITALGEQLQGLDIDLLGRELDEGERADYQRGLDAYESAKSAIDNVTAPDAIRHVTEIIEDGRYAIACVRARVDDEPLPARRPPCFFDPRHGLSTEDVEYSPPGGAPRDVPACALDAERVKSGAEPDIRKVMDGPQRVPYWEGGAAYAPYAAGYFSAFSIMPAMFMGTMMGSMMFGGFDGGFGDMGGDVGDAGGDAGGDGGLDFGGDGGGFDFGGFDF